MGSDLEFGFRSFKCSLRFLLSEWREAFLGKWIDIIKDETNKQTISTKNRSSNADFDEYTCMHKMEKGEQLMKTTVECPDECPISGDCREFSNSPGLRISISKEKVSLVETFLLLHLFETYLQWPSEETAKPLIQLFDRVKGAYSELLAPEKHDKNIEILRTFLVKQYTQNSDNENQDSDYENYLNYSVNRNLDYDVYLNSQPRSISEDTSQLDLENEKSSSFSQDFENNKNSFENKNINESEKFNQVKSKATQTDDQKIFEDNLVQPSHEPKTKVKQEPRKILITKAKDSSIKREIVSSDQYPSIFQLHVKEKSNQKPERRTYQNLNMIDDAFPYVNKGKQGKDIDRYIEYSSTEKGMLYEKISGENAWESRNGFQFRKAQPLILIKTLRVKELEEENLSLQKQLESLKFKHEEILAEFGEFTVQKTAKQNKKRNSELFQRIFPSPLTEAKRSVVTPCNDRRINDDITEDERLDYPKDHQNGYQKSSHGNGSTSNCSPNGPPNVQTTTENDDHPPFNTSVAYTAATGEKRVQQGDGTLLQESNPQPRTEEMVTRDKDHQQSTGMSTYRNNSENQNPTMQNSSNITPREKTSGGEGTNQSGKRKEVKGNSVLASTSRDEINDESSTRRSYEDLPFSVQQDESNAPEYISLGNIPPTSVATTVYNNYKLLLLSLAERLLSSEVVKLKDWATQTFSIENPQNSTDVLFQLDQKGVINASDLSQLSDFFECIVRIDLVYVIDAFLVGDYSLLREIPASKKRDATRPQNPQNGTTSRYPSFSNAVNNGQSSVNWPSRATFQSSAARNAAASRKPENSNGRQSSIPQQTQKAASPNFSITTNPKLFSKSPNEHQSTTHEQPTGFIPARMSDTIRVDGPVTNERRTTASNSTTRTNPPVVNKARNTPTVGGNCSKHSKFQRPDTERGNATNSQSPAASRNHVLYQEDNWLCSHYKRHCYVKFECCEEFWPCHRCHNNQSSCGRRKLKSRDTKMAKCVYCNKVQQFGQFCCDCAAQFANYYCGLCKHLTGRDDHPYHCEKCGICRIHGDRSFHCDICGVCLDVQLRGNHKCREGSAHDECCICLEDAFTGCQILPCSHKVHKECATQMIRSGITRCPICRESFAHKLERRPPSSGKHSGK